MGRLKFIILAVFLGALAMGGDATAAEPENTLVMDLKDGPVIIELRPDLAPNHVAGSRNWFARGFKTGSSFTRSSTGS